MATSPWALCTSGSAIIDAGVNVNTDIKVSGSTLQNWSNQVESDVCNLVGTDVVTNFGDLTANGKQVLNEYCSARIAQKMVNFDISGYTTQREAETVLDVLENIIVKIRKLLDTSFVKTYLKVN